MNTYLNLVHWLAAGNPDSVNSYDSAHGAPPECFAACNYGHNSCTYTASQQLEKTLVKQVEIQHFHCYCTLQWKKKLKQKAHKHLLGLNLSYLHECEDGR